MAFEKAKVLKAAEKFLSQGKIDSAIKEYRQIVENDENDFTTLNMLGDLCVRSGKKDEAIFCFIRIAEHYRDTDFNLKAIAMYKKVERLKPRDPEIAKNLAALYAAQGLIIDARAQYLIVADAYTRTGQVKYALEILQKIADLEPLNVEIRLKLAEGYLKERLPAEAADAFKEAAHRLYQGGEFDRSLEASSKALELKSYDEKALEVMLAAHIARGTPSEAAEFLEKAVADKPEYRELISMLADAYVAAENPKGAERAITKLTSFDATKYTRFVSVVRLYLKLEEPNEAARVLARTIEQMLAGREEAELLDLVNQVLEHDPKHVEALRLLVRIYWWQRDMDKLRVTLEQLLEAAQTAELIEDERYALTQLVRLAPDEPSYLERLHALGGAPEEIVEEPIEEPMATSDLSAGDVPSFETFAVVTDAGDESQFQSEFETNSVEEPTFADPSASFADLNESVADASGHSFGSNNSSAGNTNLSGSVEFDFGGSEAPSAVADSAATHSSLASQKHEAMMRQELESVDFYLTQGYFDIAIDTLQMLEREFGSHPEIDARRERLNAATQGSEAAASQAPLADQVTTERAGFEFGAAADATRVQQPDGSKPGIDLGLAEIFEEFKVAAEGEAISNEDYETYYNMGTAYKEMDLLDEAIQEFQTAASLSKPGDGTPRYLQCCNMLGHCFAQKHMPRAAMLWFKKGLESPGHSDEEYLALRYELGSTYEQLGDINRALDVFTEVYGADIAYRDVADKIKELQLQKEPSKKKKRR
jgi:tetratricopeptide (TPR) repeat protein